MPDGYLFKNIKYTLLYLFVVDFMLHLKSEFNAIKHLFKKKLKK